MKKTGILIAMAAVAGVASAALTSVNTAYTDLRTGVVGGTESAGDIVEPVPGTFGANDDTATTFTFDLRWTGLNLDDVGADNDYIDYTFRLTSSNGNVDLNGQGMRASGGAWQVGDTLTLEYVSSSVTADTAGLSANFTGFTSAGLGTSGNASTANGDSVAALINGIGVTNVMDGTGAYQYKNKNVDFAATDSVVWELTQRDNTTVNGWTRNMSYGFEIVPEPGTLGLIAVFGGGVLFIRRRFMM
ncbi:PEP-CTERM sorting domain-containing protein [Pontiella agarivorans]|uniref:PEP-CTERM sorting domain-containing protein n=1 Tax=Pontiella agarivorans TaxID=3038953 RepID=A0ABU5MUA1_9BACT|nr:PEP-CTERM sorting domain-containing protein [Pontiella agarivorans]MDZ8117792.1 PEP-CTERM sorting domain-containing protein [Pontiella agarivorans]